MTYAPIVPKRLTYFCSKPVFTRFTRAIIWSDAAFTRCFCCGDCGTLFYTDLTRTIWGRRLLTTTTTLQIFYRYFRLFDEV